MHSFYNPTAASAAFVSRSATRRALGVLLFALFVGWAASAGAEGPVVNVNTATLEELQALPGVGETRARAILDARADQGGFERVDDLLAVKGIGPSSLERLRPHARITGPTQIGDAKTP